MKKVVMILMLVLCVFATRLVMGAEEDDTKTTEEHLKITEDNLKTMRAKPDMVSTDSIFVGYSIDKLYYQNTKITQLLENISKQLQELPSDFNKTFSSQNLEIIQLLKEIRSLLAEPRVKLPESVK